MFKNLFKSTFIGLLNKAIAAIGGFFLLPFMLKQLGSGNFGIWVVISSSVGLMGFLDLGIGNTLMNYIALNSNNKLSIIKYIKLAYLVQLIFVSTLVILFVSTFNFINWGAIFNINSPSVEVLSGIAITVLCFFINLLTSSIYSIKRGLQKSQDANTWQLFGTIIYLTTMWLVLTFKPTLPYIALANFGIPLIISGFYTALFIYNEKLFSIDYSITLNVKEILSFTADSGLLLFLQIAALICFETDCLILAHYTNYNDVAKFAVLAKIYSIPTVLLGVYLQVLWPAYAKAFSQNQWHLIKRSFNNSLWLSLTGTAIFIILVFALKSILLKHWLSNQVDIPASLFIVFSLLAIVNALDSNIAIMLNGLNKIKVQLYLAFFMVLSNIVLSILLAKQYGTSGVVWGTFISTLCFSVIPFYFYIKKLFGQNIPPTT